MPCGMARLAIVIPAMTSDLKKLKLYRGAHSRIGSMYCNHDTSFCQRDWFLNCRKGSSGKKVSLRSDFNFFEKGRGGGTLTRWAHSTFVAVGYTKSWLPMGRYVTFELHSTGYETNVTIWSVDGKTTVVGVLVKV